MAQPLGIQIRLSRVQVTATSDGIAFTQLARALKSVKDTVNQNGLVPFLSVFRALPRFSFIKSIVPLEKERMDPLCTKRRGMETTVSQQRLKKFLN